MSLSQAEYADYILGQFGLLNLETLTISQWLAVKHFLSYIIGT